MFLKPEKPEMDGFEEESNSGFKEKFNIWRKYFEKKVSQNSFAYSFVSEHSSHFFLYSDKKKCIF